MAIAATAVFQCRPNGNDLNGAGYDGTTYAGGTDYTQQDAAQASWSNLSCTGSASTTLTDSSSTGLFTAAMVGNAIYIPSGTGFSVGYYFIVSRTSTNAVVLDRTPASAATAASAGAGKVGGAAKQYQIVTSVGLTGSTTCTVQVYTPSGVRTPVRTTLSAAISTTGATSCTVTSTSGFPSTPFYLNIDQELVQVTGVASTTLTITRAQGGSSAATHSSGAPATVVDYVWTTGATLFCTGSSSTGPLKVTGQNGRPMIWLGNRHDWMSGGGGNGYGILDNVGFIIPAFAFNGQASNFGYTGTGVTIQNCYFYLAAAASFGGGMIMRWDNGQDLFIDNEVEGDATTPANSGGNFIYTVGNFHVIRNNVFRNMPGTPIQCNYETIVEGNVIYNCYGDGVLLNAGSGSNVYGAFRHNTIDTVTAGHGLNFGNGNTGMFVWNFIVENNLLSNITGAGKAGIAVGGTQSVNDLQSVGKLRNNAFYNCTANYSGLSAKTGDVTGQDPQYTSKSGGDFSVGTNMKAKGAPTLTRFSSTSYVDIGALQRAEPAAGLPYSRPEMYNVG